MDTDTYTGAPAKRAGRQQFQEEEYSLPYHWLIERATKKGAVYFGYWNLALRYAESAVGAKTLAGKDVLDAGCGDGFFTSLIAAKNPRSVVGVDYSARAVSFARILVPTASFHVENLASLPFPEKSFDILFLIEVMEHISDSKRKNIIKEFSRILRNDGIIVLSSPSTLMPVIEKHEQHFSESTFGNALVPYFTPAHIGGQDKAGYFRTWYLFFFLLAKNRFWTFHPMVRFLTEVVYRRFLNETPLHCARRYIGIFKKTNEITSTDESS